MQNTKRNSRIYLSGGGNETQSFPLDKFFFGSLPINGNFLYIPIALRGHKLYQSVQLWMRSILARHGRQDVQFTTTDDLFKIKSLDEFCAIYIGGGNTWSLLQEIKDSGFGNLLLQYIKYGGQVYGGSAGAIIFGKNIDTHNDENVIGSVDVIGLNVLYNFSIACHFDITQQERYAAWAINKQLPIVCLSEDTGLIVESNVAQCIGASPCTVFNADGTKSDIYPNEVFKLD